MKTPIVIAAVSVLALGAAGLGYSLLAQGGKDAHEEAGEDIRDYGDDLSAVAAREFLTEINELSEIVERDESTGAAITPPPATWPAPPDVSDWAGHYLVLQGENYLPVRRAFATPIVTLFDLEDGYTPHSPFSRLESDDGVCGSGLGDEGAATGGGVVSSPVVADAAEAAGDSVSAVDRLGLLGCPKRLGIVWGSGSYVVDENGENLAGQDFSDGVKLFHGRDFFDMDEDDEDGGFVVVFEGGPDRTGDPAITPLPFWKAIVLDYPVLRREPGADDIPDEKTYVQPAPDLPVTVWPGVTVQDAGNGTALIPLEELLDAINDAIDAAGEDGEDDPEYLLVHRSDPAFDQDAVLERLRKIRERVRQHGSVRTVSFGQEAPICTDDTDDCWSLNRSLILYKVR
ncbi:hypothetical protein [Hyphomonas sp.]|uniref:hypothetical protein n=1 Tax=Hyphomonas sp. TaxID=87 RepID=UPI003527EC34